MLQPLALMRAMSAFGRSCVGCKFSSFDFSAEHGQSDALVRERCVHALDPSERNKAGSLWSVLCEIAQNVADSGGEIAAETLRTNLGAVHGFRLAGLRQNRAALTALSEKAQHALQDLRYRVGRATLSRREWMEKVNTALDGGRYVEVLGAPGVGKSGIMRALAVQTAASSKIIFLSPQRTTPRGWSALATR
jgi:ABC-type glutathione transport system ATPase component